MYVLRFKDDCDFNWFNGVEPRPVSSADSADFGPKRINRRKPAFSGLATRDKAFEGELPGQ